MPKEEPLEILKQGKRVWNEWRQHNPGMRVDLRDTYLAKAHLDSFDLHDVDFSRADLTEANLSEANLIGADLSYAHLRNADLTMADLQGATLISAGMGEADLSGANLQEANLMAADLEKANLEDAELPKAILAQANLKEANLQGANLCGADLTWATFTRANLTKANLNKAILVHADLGGDVMEDLQGVELYEADLSEADLSYANLNHAHLINSKLDRSILNHADLTQAALQNANLIGASLHGADLYEANLSGANLTEADLSDAQLYGANLVHVNLERSKLNNCFIYGISAWDVTLNGAEQNGLIVTPKGESIITVDNLETAQFIYLQKAKAAKKLQSLQAALRYLDECGKLTIEKLLHLATLRGMEIDEETLEELSEVIEKENAFPGDPENETNLRADIREGLIKAIQVTDAEAKGIPEPTTHEYRSFIHEDQLLPRRLGKVPVLLYKYFPANRLEDVVRNRTVRFSQPSAVNDPFDVLPAILFACDSDTRAKLRATLAEDADQALEMLDIPDDDPEGLRDFFLDDLDDEVEGHITMLNLHLKQEEERLRSSFDSQIGMLCLTERNDSILMWSHYADNHCGFAVGFWMNCSFFSSDTLASNERPQPITYSTNRPIFTSDGPPPADPMFGKSAEWSYENEWRVIRRLKAADKVKPSSPSSPFPIYLFTIPQEAFHSIIFGCRAPATLLENCRKWLAEDRKMDHVQLLEAFPSQDRFLLEVRERGWKDNVEVHVL